MSLLLLLLYYILYTYQVFMKMAYPSEQLRSMAETLYHSTLILHVFYSILCFTIRLSVIGSP